MPQKLQGFHCRYTLNRAESIPDSLRHMIGGIGLNFLWSDIHDLSNAQALCFHVRLRSFEGKGTRLLWRPPISATNYWLPTNSYSIFTPIFMFAPAAAAAASTART